MEIYHNTRCRKSREALHLIEESNTDVTIIEYLKNPLSETELEVILMKLNMKPEEIVRKGEKLYKEKFKGLEMNDHEWIKILSDNPVLIERPIVVKGNSAIIGRPPENVKKFL
ncbi:MAG: arsenate reductase (glutaredoxin) [Flavobacteriales bacterium]|nr:arsenate reductase (glutaredoxin) [Flavobacteriales bacterium]